MYARGEKSAISGCTDGVGGGVGSTVGTCHDVCPPPPSLFPLPLLEVGEEAEHGEGEEGGGWGFDCDDDLSWLVGLGDMCVYIR